MEQDYLTVKQFAEQSGCTPQRVYQLLRNRLQPFLIVENNVKYIHIDGLQEVERARVAQGYNKVLQRVEDIPEPEQEPERRTQEQEKPADSPAEAGSDVLQLTIDALTAQLGAKDKQINDLTAALASTQKTLTEMQHTQQVLTDALTVSQQTQKQLSDALAASQALQAGTIQALRDIQLQNQPEPPQEAVIDSPAEDDETPEPEQQPEPAPVPAEEEKKETAPAAEEPEQPKKKWWQLLFQKG